MEMRLLNQNDAMLWKKLRLEALLGFPQNYLSSYEDENQRTHQQWQEVVNQNKIYGLFIDGQLISTVALSLKSALKHQHKGEIWGVYTQPRFQGQGLAGQLMKYVLDDCKKYLKLCYLTCTTSNQGAFRIYEKLGFETYGVEKNAICVNGQYFDEYLMAIHF
jgi:ribosomal protein S18 acetylase RimI-like enzyme